LNHNINFKLIDFNVYNKKIEMLLFIYEKIIKLLIIKFQTIKFHFKVHKIRMSSINNISLFVPHVYSNFTSAMVMEVFNGLHIGEVKSVDLVSKMGSDSKHYNAVYIHFTYWYDTKIARDFQKRLLDHKEEVRVMYDHPWYWIVLENKGKKHVSGDRKPRIDLGDFNTPNKPIIPALNITPNKIKKTKPYVQLPTPLNLEAAFDSEYANNGFTQEELDWLENQAELDKAKLDKQYHPDKLELVECITRLTCEVDLVNAQLKSLNAQLNLAMHELDSTVTERNSYTDLYVNEMLKNTVKSHIL
jgi:hypothetical protein